VIASMYVGNMMLLVLNVPLIPMWVKVLKIPYPILFPLIILFCIVGVYSISFDVAEIYIMFIFGLVGYLMKKCDFEGAPLALAFVLSPLMENAVKQSLKMSDGSFSIFFERPISAVLLGIAFLSVITTILPWIRTKVLEFKSKTVEKAND
jgi:putative tricarboxylic transport membrane protein